jgi:nucleotide-binding universal stress UspA family protein
MNIQRILVPVDFLPASEYAIEYGSYLAKAFSAEIFLLHILESEQMYPPEWFGSKNQNADSRFIRKKVSEKLGEHSKNIKKKYGIVSKTILTIGKPATKIAETVLERSINLIVMGTHGASGFEEFFIGHTAHKVVNISPCPVITLREGFTLSAGIKSIVLPIDESLHSRQKVQNVISVASKCKSIVHILGVIQSKDKSEVAKFNIKVNSVEKAVKKAGLVCTRKVIKGSNVALEAMNYAEEVNAELLAIMTDHESNMTGTFMGAFAQQIINHSIVPVLSIKPAAGFFSYPL